MIGDQQKYLVALVGIELDTVGDWATRRELAVHHLRRPLGEARGRSADRRMGRRTSTATSPGSNRSRPSGCSARELDHEGGELTATQKVKRRAIADEFVDLIEEMYR